MKTGRPPKNELAHLVAEAERARRLLDAAITDGLAHAELEPYVAARVSALEALAEAMKLVPAAADAFVPKCDRHRPHASPRSRPQPDFDSDSDAA